MVNFVSYNKSKGKEKNKKRPSVQIAKLEKKEKLRQKKCFFCGKNGHFKKNYLKRKNWFEKRGTNLSLVCHETNLTDVPPSSWWVDSSTTIHVTSCVQGFLSSRKPNDGEKTIAMGSWKES